jgi:hypothetical protein
VSVRTETSPRAGRARPVLRRLQDWSWVLLVLVGLGGALFSLYFLLIGPTDLQTRELVGQDWSTWAERNQPADRLVALGFALAGLNGLVAGLLGIAIAAGPFRRGERWAWFAMASFLLVVAGAQVVNWRVGLGADKDAPVLVTLIVLALLLPLPKFFGEQSRRTRSETTPAT